MKELRTDKRRNDRGKEGMCDEFSLFQFSPLTEWVVGGT